MSAIQRQLRQRGSPSTQSADKAAFELLSALRRRAALLPSHSRSQTMNDIARIPDHAIRLIFATIHSFGMTSWRPDLLGDHSSSYNAALEAIAIWTFEQAVATFAYAHMRVNPEHAQNTQLIQSLYRNFVWSYMKNRIVKDLRSPGIVAQADLDNKAYKRRSEVRLGAPFYTTY